MLTVDTHHVEGYRCSICTNEYDTRTKNVVSCADRQIAEFIEWCKEQEFYKDTVIVITGDHPRMDTEMVDGIDMSARKTYNCYINCNTDKNVKTTERTFTALDIFPTTLQALGFKWNSSRLGLGTSLFSDEQTLAEELGLEYFDSELSKKTKYVTRFYK
jgi:phosphoglycerol transferase